MIRQGDAQGTCYGPAECHPLQVESWEEHCHYPIPILTSVAEDKVMGWVKCRPIGCLIHELGHHFG